MYTQRREEYRDQMDEPRMKDINEPLIQKTAEGEWILT